MSIELSHIHAGYPNKPVLKDVSLSLPDTGVFSINGPSGSGKTTLLRVFAGLLPYTGDITGLAGKKISFVFQEDRLLPWRTAEENVDLALPAQCEREVARDWLRRMDLLDVTQAYPAALSGGMQRRVAIARACAYGGDILLLDEPFQGLDDALRARIAPHIRTAAPLILLVTHDAKDAAMMGAQPIVTFS